jgi:hypothetical protein
MFEENSDARGGCQLANSSIPSLKTASALIGVDAEELHHALISRVSFSIINKLLVFTLRSSLNLL